MKPKKPKLFWINIKRRLEPKHVNITGLDRPCLLAAFYAAVPWATDQLTEQEASTHIAARMQRMRTDVEARYEGLVILKVGNHPLGVRLDKSRMPVQGFDLYYGPGAARRVVRTLRRQMRQERKKRLKALAL